MRASLTVTILLASLAGTPATGQDKPAGDDPDGAARLRVGTFDPRGVAVAWYRSEEDRQAVAEHAQALADARRGDDSSRVARLERDELIDADLRRRRVFGRGRIDGILERLGGRVAAVAKASGVDVLCEQALFTRPAVEAVDLTEALAKELDATEQTLAIVRRVQKVPAKPLAPRPDKGKPKPAGPCYRPKPDADVAKNLTDRLGKATATVYPAFVRFGKDTATDADAGKRLAGLLRTRGLLVAEASDGAVDLGEPVGPAQYDHFLAAMKRFAATVKASPPETDFAVLVEVLATRRRSGGLSVGGIHCYVLDAEGRNAASFLINAHHAPFASADLRVDGSDAEARAKLLDAAMDALGKSIAMQYARHKVGQADKEPTGS